MMLPAMALWLLQDLNSEFESQYAKVRESTARAIVTIDVDREAEEKQPRGSGLMNMLQGGSRIFAKRPKAPVTGLVVDPEGWILTTRYNVAGTLKGIHVTLSDGRKLDAELKGYEMLYDIALLKVDAKDLPTLSTRKLEDLGVGDAVVAIGAAPEGDGVTLTQGIVSALDRMSGFGIQHDARLNYGNVGGPLVDLSGRLIGMTCKVSSLGTGPDDPGQNSGVGYAVTWDRIVNSLPSLKEGAKSRAPFLGIQGGDGDGGVKIQDAMKGLAAAEAGVLAGDVFLEFGGEKVTTMAQLKTKIERRRAGDKVKIKLRRGEEILDLEATLGERPEGQ